MGGITFRSQQPNQVLLDLRQRIENKRSVEFINSTPLLHRRYRAPLSSLRSVQPVKPLIRRFHNFLGIQLLVLEMQCGRK